MHRRLLVWLLAAGAAVSQQTSSPAPGTIDGATVDGNGLGLPKIRVTLRGVATPGANAQPPASQVATSDGDGKFSFEGVGPGNYTLTADSAGYTTTVYRPSGASASTVFPVSAGQHVSGITMRMIRQIVLSGLVTDEDGKPMARVTVRPMRKQFLNGLAPVGTAGAGVATGADGKFEMTVAPGRWYLSYTAPRPAARRADANANGKDEVERGYVTEYYPGVANVVDAMGFDVTAGQERSGLDVKLRKADVFHIRGKATGEGELQIQVSEPGGDPSGNLFDQGTAVAADGSFDIRGLPAGQWTLTLVKAAGSRDSLAQRTISIGNRSVEDVMLTARPPVGITGWVKMVPEQQAAPAPGTPAPSAPAQVRLFPLDSAAGVAVAPVERDGSFALAGVGARRFRVEVAAPVGGYVKSITYGGQEALDAGIDVTEGGGLPLGIVISMTAGTVSGTVRVESGQPPPGVVTLVPVSMQPAGALYRADLHRTAASDGSGQFRVASVPPGTYRVYAWEHYDALLVADPNLLKLFESQGTSVTVAENDVQTVTVTQIPAERMNDEMRRHGR